MTQEQVGSHAKHLRRRMRRLGVRVTWREARSHALWGETGGKLRAGGAYSGRQFRLSIKDLKRIEATRLEAAR